MTQGRQLGFLWGAVALLAVAMFRLLPQEVAAPRCVFKVNLGVPCLTCGSTRVALALRDLDVITAFATNPLVTAYAVILVCGGLIAGGLAWANRPLPGIAWPGATRWLLVAGVLLNWVYLLWVGI